jgi:DNA-binding SARP family transcriptional activator
LAGRSRGPYLAALLLQANQVVSEQRLYSLVWGDRPPATVRGQLQICVSGLRKLLGPEAIRRERPGDVLEAAPGELDLDVFTAEVEQASAEPASRGVGPLAGAGVPWPGQPCGAWSSSCSFIDLGKLNAPDH